MHRTTVLIPHDLKVKASQMAHAAGMSLGEFVRMSIELRCSTNTKVFDVFLDDRRCYEGEIPKDLSKNHDDYLY